MNETPRLLNVQVDTVEMRKCGEEIQKLVVEYQQLISEFYTRISKISTNQEWIGDQISETGGTSAIQFIQRSLKEIPNYQDFGEALQKYGQELMDYARVIEEFSVQEKIGGK